MVKKTATTEEKKVQGTVLNKDLDVYQGEFKDRRYGIRIDDDIEVTVIAGNDVIRIKGRLLSMKEEIELLDIDGNYIQIMADWVVAIKVLKHNRPPPDQDQELTKKPTIKPKPKKPAVDHAYY
jgi:uncharacterized protein YxjI